LNSTYTVFIRPAATLDRLSSLLDIIGSNTSYSSIVIYQSVTASRSVEVVSVLSTIIPTCSGSVLERSVCIIPSTLYEITVRATLQANDNHLLESDLQLWSLPQLGSTLEEPLIANLRALGVTSQGASIEWKERNDVRSTILQISPRFGGETALINHSGTEPTLIQGCLEDSPICLEPFKQYQVSVTALSPERSAIDLIQFHTSEAAPTSTVRNTTTPSIMSRSIQVAFMLPLQSNGVITHVLVDVDQGTQLQVPINSSAQQQWTRPNQAHSIAVLALKPFTAYHLALRAVNSKGTGPSTTILATTDEDVPSAPRNPTLSAIATLSGQVQLRWQPPAPANGVILEYELVVNKINSSKFDLNVTLAFNATSTNITLATEDDKVQLRARTSVGWGPWSEPAIFAQGSGSDPAPQNSLSAQSRILPFAGAAVFCVVLALAALRLKRSQKQVNMNFRPEVDEYEVLREQVDLMDIIGSGAHGEVFKAVGRWGVACLLPCPDAVPVYRMQATFPTVLRP
jgi:hypothetical protein